MPIIETFKWLAYRLPLVSKVGAPQYPYKITPGELCQLIAAIDATKGNKGSIVEVGVARGMTSFFLAKHLQSTQDDRQLVLLDTFSGFDDASIEYEVKQRQKSKSEISAFWYHSRRVFENQIRNIPYKNIKVLQADAAKFDYASIAPIDAALIDIDLYIATKATAQHMWPHLSPGGTIVIDDCVPGGPWDGSLQAYQELCNEFHCEPRFVGRKGGVLVKPR